MKQFFQKHKKECYLFLIWEALHLCLFTAGYGHDGFYPGIDHARFNFDIDEYGITELCIYTILLPICLIAYLDLIWIPNAKKKSI